MKIPIYVINLERSIDRLKAIENNFSDLGLIYTRIPAVDGRKITNIKNKNYDEKLNKKLFFSPLSPNEIACFMSHRAAWIKIVSEAKYAIILEDDVEFSAISTQILERLEDVLNVEQPLLIKLYAKRGLLGRVVGLIGDYSIIQQTIPTLGAVAYALNKSAAENLILGTKKFGQPVDVYIQSNWEHKVEVLSLSPSIFNEISHKLGGSTIQKKIKRSAHKILMREISRSIFRLGQFIKSLKYRTKIWLKN
jgi:glycosyl transferase, family 25